MWLSHFTAAQLTGSEIVPFEDIMEGISADQPKIQASKKSNEQIKAEGMQAVARYEQMKRKGESA